MEGLFEFLFSNGIFVLLIVYLIVSAVSRVLKGAAEGSQQQKPQKQQKRQSWANPWDSDAKEESVGELKERLQQKHGHSLSENRVAMDSNSSDPVISHNKSNKPSYWAQLPKEEWKRGIILKEILDPPKSRRRRGYPHR